MFASITEEYLVGAAGSSATGADPWYYVVGAEHAYSTYGLGNWWASARIVTMDGLEHNATNEGPISDNVHRVGATLSSAPKLLSSLLGTNGCYTAINTDYDDAGPT